MCSRDACAVHRLYLCHRPARPRCVRRKDKVGFLLGRRDDSTRDRSQVRTSETSTSVAQLNGLKLTLSSLARPPPVCFQTTSGCRSCRQAQLDSSCRTWWIEPDDAQAVHARRRGRTQGVRPHHHLSPRDRAERELRWRARIVPLPDLCSPCPDPVPSLCCRSRTYSDPFVVVILSLAFIASIFFLHISSKIIRNITKP